MSGIPRLELIDVRRSERGPAPRLRARGVPPSLEGRELFHSVDPNELSRFLEGFLGRARVTLDARGEEFDCAVHIAELSSLALAHLELESPTTIDVPATADAVWVIVHTYGESHGMVGSRHLTSNATRAIVVSPGAHLRMTFLDPASQLIVRIDRGHVEATLARMIGRGVAAPLVFDPVLDLASGRSVRWNIAMQLLGAELMTPDSLLHRGVGQAELEELLAGSLLLLQENSYSEELVPHSGRKNLVLAVTDHVERHLGETLSTSIIAAAVGVGARRLQLAFRDTLGMTPTEYVRVRRLERARADLSGASVGEAVSVSAVAERWGFGHLGDFAMQYRRRFGETPSETLRGR